MNGPAGAAPSAPPALPAPFAFARKNAAGIALAGAFALAYLLLGLRLNSPIVDTTDNYLDADNFTWMRRIAWEDGSQLEMRGPHPYAYFIFRPVGRALALTLGDPFLAAVTLNSLAGGLCVYLAWRFVSVETGAPLYAGLIAALLGLTTSHIWFGSIVESYIFSAAALLALFVLLQRSPRATLSHVAAAIIVLGITVTNAAQAFIGFFLARRNLRALVVFVAIVLIAGMVLTIVHAWVYPSGALLFEPEAASTERGFAIDLRSEPGWRAAGRVILVARTMLLYTIVAPRPYVFTDEVGGIFPRFNFFRIAPGAYAFSSYSGLGTILVAAWGLMCVAASILFVQQLVKTRVAELPVAFLLCLGFNFVLHLFYGYEPFLYSPDWAYALVLFVGVALRPFARSTWVLGSLAIFLALLAWHQVAFIASVLQTVQTFLQ